jgi:hypothetical protein
MSRSHNLGRAIHDWGPGMHRGGTALPRSASDASHVRLCWVCVAIWMDASPNNDRPASPG